MLMNNSELRDVENRLWSAADQLWANTGLKPSEFSTPVLGLIFLRYAEKRFAEAHAALLKSGMKPKDIDKSDYQADGVLYLPEKARFSNLLTLQKREHRQGHQRSDGRHRGRERRAEGRAAARLHPDRKSHAGRAAAPACPDRLEGDAFGKIYEYFLGNFALPKGRRAASSSRRRRSSS